MSFLILLIFKIACYLNFRNLIFYALFLKNFPVLIKIKKLIVKSNYAVKRIFKIKTYSFSITYCQILFDNLAFIFMIESKNRQTFINSIIKIYDRIELIQIWKKNLIQNIRIFKILNCMVIAQIKSFCLNFFNSFTSKCYDFSPNI